MHKTSEKPSKLYKYEAFSERSLQNLKAQVIYFGSPKNFNDPYDCALKPIIKAPSDQDVESFRVSLQNLPFSNKTFDKFQEPSTNKLREIFQRSCERIIKDATDAFINRGVSCFSEVNDNLLMWSHYAGKYKGFCLEFDTIHPPFERLHKVKYLTQIPHIESATLVLNDNLEPVIDLFSTKSISWSYEKEWRVIHAQADTAYHYSSECLTGIYFGPEISAEALEIICLVLQGQNPHVKFWKGRRSDTEFKVEFDEFTFRPHLMAR